MCFDGGGGESGPSGADDLAYDIGRGDQSNIPNRSGNNPATGGASNGSQAAALLGLGSSATGLGIQPAKGTAEFAGQNAGGFDTTGGKIAAIGQNIANHPGRTAALSLVPGGSILNAAMHASELGIGRSPESIAYGNDGGAGGFDGGFNAPTVDGQREGEPTAASQPVSSSPSAGPISTAAKAAATSPTSTLLNPYFTLSDTTTAGGPTGSTVSDQVLFNKGKNSKVVY